MAELIQGQTAGNSIPTAETKQTGDAPAGGNVSRWAVFLHSCFFVLGFTLVFTLLGSAAGLLGRSLNEYMDVLQKLGALLLVVFALATMGVFRWLVRTISKRVDVTQNPAAEALVSVLDFPNKLLYTEKRVGDMNKVNRSWGYLSSMGIGVAFAAGWVPCIGPILASILFLAGDSQTVWQGASLLFVYSIGLGIPFLLTGAMFSSMSGWLRKLNRHAGIIGILSGLLMLLVAYLLWTGEMNQLTTRFQILNDGMLRLNESVQVAEEWLGQATGTSGYGIAAATNWVAILLAFAGGVVSFLSPCVLPLVPAYIGFLSGAAVGTRPQTK
ncbi:MAG: sulfite exporter TauE/SafE family protein [Anaerolineales bacterium]|nr:sulfite exporter TauE/SafE family protein [Anaerolineales bacterium]